MNATMKLRNCLEYLCCQKKTMLKLFVVGLCSLAVILIAKEFGGKSSPKVRILTDYPNSTWYSEQLGDMIEVGEDFEYEDEMPGMSMIKDFRGELTSFFLYHKGAEYWILFRKNETALEGIRFTGEITEEDTYTYMTFHDFLPMGKESVEGREQITEMFGSQGKVVFKKVPNQHFDQYPNSIWKSEEMGYTLVVPDEKDLEDHCAAEFWVEQKGDKELYEFFEPLYNAHAYGSICYSPELEEKYIIDFHDYIDFDIFISEENGDLYMTLSDLEFEKDCPEKVRKYFLDNSKIILKKVK